MLLAAVSKADSVIQFLTVLIIFVIVLGATWFTTRYIAGVQKGKLKGNNFEVIDSFRLSPNKYIQIIRIGNRYLAIAVCKDTVTVLTELDKECILHPEELYAGNPVQFEVFLKRAKSLVHKNDRKAADKDEK